MHLLSLLALLLPAVVLTPKPPPARVETAHVLGVLVKACNDRTSKDIFPLCTPDFQKRLPRPTLDAVLRQVHLKYGTLPAPLPRPRDDKGWRIYRVRASRQPVTVRVRFDAHGYLAGLRFMPAFLDDLPAGPLFLDEVQGRLRDAVEETRRVYRVPSISLALVKGDRVVWAHAFGDMNRARAVPADTETAYVTGSIFKVVVATALMQLVDEGKLDLDAPVNRYTKDFQVPNPFEKKTPLTLRHLLSHHGGVPNGAQIVDLWSRRLPTPLDEVVRKQVKVTTRPGTKFEYSNYAFTFNGWLLGKVADSSFDSTLRRRLLDPLDMKHTVFEPTAATCENLAVPYQVSLDGKEVKPTPRTRLDVYPAGDVYSTPTDLAHFLILHLNGGRYAGKQVLSARAVAEMATPQFVKKGEHSGVGLGWMIQSDGKHRTLWHNGAVPGFYTMMGLDPDLKVGVVLFSNSMNPLATVLGVQPDPLVDLRTLALELLARLDAAAPAATP
jgi:CubicO group peptidase (beta-lactamase class C family)